MHNEKVYNNMTPVGVLSMRVMGKEGVHSLRLHTALQELARLWAL